MLTVEKMNKESVDYYISSFCKNNQVDFAASFGSTLDVYRSTDEGLTWSGDSAPSR